MNLLETIIAGAIGAVFLVSLQTRSARGKADDEFRRAEFSEALKVIDALGQSIDKRIQANTRFWERAKQPDYSEEDRKAFRIAIDEWMSQYSASFSKIYHYFGNDEQIAFSDLQRNISHLSRVMVRHIDIGYNNLSPTDKKEDDAVDLELKLLRKDARELLTRLNVAAASGGIGRSQYINDIEKSDPGSLSKVYLFQRLMGWKR